MRRGFEIAWLGILVVAAISCDRKDSVPQAPPASTESVGRWFEDLPVDLVWNSPSKDARGSMPIGNGDIGANVWVEPNGDLLFYLSKTDAWSENCRLLKLGKVRLSLDPALYTEGMTFKQELDLANGLIQLTGSRDGETTRVTFRIDANHPTVFITVDGSREMSLSAAFEPWRTERRELKGKEKHSAYGLHGRGGPQVFVEPDTVVEGRSDSVLWYHRNERSIWADNLKLQALGDWTDRLTDPLLHRTFGVLMRGEGMTSASATQLSSVKPSRGFELRLTALTGQTPTAGEWIKNIEALDRSVPDGGDCLAAHCGWWQAFWNRSWIIVSGDADAERVTRAYALQRWIIGGSGRGNSPIKFNGSIFTMDTKDPSDLDKGFDADYRQWGGPYWWQNTRLPYWGMMASGDTDLMQPLYDMFLASLPLRKAATRAYYGHDGAYYTETQYFWGTFVDGNYGRDRSKLPDGMTENTYIRYYWQGGLELSLMMLDTYAHTRDADFARDKVLPLVSEVITFFDQHWKRDENGKIRFDPAMALETYHSAVNPIVEIVAIRKVCESLLALPESLTTPAQRKQWQRLIGELPSIPTRTVNGQILLAPAEEYREKKNVENPELYTVFPYRVYGVGKPDLDLARRTFAARGHKGTGGWQQNAIQAARLGLTDEAQSMVTENASRVAKGYRFPAIWGPNFDWIPDQDHGSVMILALQQMLLQSDPPSGKILLFPAWPKEWDVDFKLHAPRQTTVECEVRNGKVVKLVITPESRRQDVVICEPFGLDGD